MKTVTTLTLIGYFNTVAGIPAVLQFNKASLPENDYTMEDHVAPVIGVLGAPFCISEDPKLFGFNSDKCEDSAVAGFNVAETKYLEQGGAEIIPIPYNLPKHKLVKLFPKLNGTFFFILNLC